MSVNAEGKLCRKDREIPYWDQVYDSGSSYHAKLIAAREYASFNLSFLRKCLKRIRDQRVLLVGGGVDEIACDLALRGNKVFVLDISSVAARQTKKASSRAGVPNAIFPIIGNAEEMCFKSRFKVVVCYRSLHHMDCEKVMTQIRTLLPEKGRFFMQEPICYSAVLKWIHKVFPFHPALYVEGEREFSRSDVDAICRGFSAVRMFYMDFLMRSSVSCFLRLFCSRSLMKKLKHADFILVNRILRCAQR